MKTTKLMVQLCLVLAAVLMMTKTNAQSLNADSVKAQMIADWERAKSYTIDYLNAMPVKSYGLKATDSVRSFAQQMLHLSQGNLFLMGMATDAPAPAWAQADLEHSATAAGKDSVMFYVTSSYDYCINAVKQTPTDKFGETKKAFGKELSRYTLMNKTFEHQTHHRGQTTVYIRLAGVKPPNERLF